MATESNPVTVTFNDFDELLQFHDLLCYIEEFMDAGQWKPQHLHERLKGDLEYIKSIRSQIHDQMGD